MVNDPVESMVEICELIGLSPGHDVMTMSEDATMMS